METHMPHRKSRFLAHWFSICTLALTLPCCGNITRGSGEPYSLQLELPGGEDPTYFWYGVQKRVLRQTHDNEQPVEIAWESGTKKALELREGDKLEFLGSDAEGRVLVSGSAVVGAEKKATIPLRRVL